LLLHVSFPLRFLLPLPTRRSSDLSGSCSAQPCRGDWMASSAGGEVAEAITVPVSASSKHALMLELPMSYPKKSISIKPLNLYLIRNLGKFKLLAYDLLTSTHRMLIPLTYSCFL